MLRPPKGISAEAPFFPGLPQTKGPVTLAERNRVTCAAVGRSGGAARSSSQNCWKLKMDIKHVKDYIYWLYYQYLLITCSYVLEPWERSMFHTITVTVFAMVVYTAYVFVPIHIRLAFEFFSQLFGGQPESTVSIVN
ncbi:serine palmitoyltransferase small subunit B isoform X1 [Lathamus discolor]|uniref:serine palmitoyltransferase small subunit B isoform X1 n=1 Tax=Lathamus discolor TaxID=678569 RepID=UPI0032B78AA9